MHKLKVVILFIFFLMVFAIGCNGNNTDNGEKEKNQTEHKFNHVCPVCGKCLDADCTDMVCLEKCPGHVQEQINIFEGFENELEVTEGEEIDFNLLYKDKLENFVVSSSSNLVEINNNVLQAKSFGEALVLVESNGQSLIINLTIKEKQDFFCDDIEIYEGESKELEISFKACKLEDLELFVSNKKITLEKEDNKYIITGVDGGNAYITISLGDYSKEVAVTIKEPKITVLNELLSVDVFDTLEIELDYPKSMISEENISYVVSKEDILKIENNTIYPLKEGKTRVKVQAQMEDKTIGKVFEVQVTVDPIAIMKMVHQEEALMLKEIFLYGENPVKVGQTFMGSVSRYFFGDLNLVESIIPIYENPYVGQTATPEIVDYLDKKKNPSVDGCPRTGVKKTSITYITYHDTGNNQSGANALNNANWMVNQYSVTTTARSWHYTVDQNQVIHSVPDDEIAYQGDDYIAYTQSIGIETCVNQGANMDMVWHRMGKLCARLMTRYDIDINHVKQHYDWMGKNCPQTLRQNGLYPYALSLIEGELLVKKYLSNYTITFESLNTEYVNDIGQIIKAPTEEIEVGYKLTITNNDGYNESVTLYTKVKPLA